jgi:UDPglucose 6-dehydrogenase
VICIDINKERVEQLRLGKLPIFEPGLGEMVAEQVGNKLFFTADYADLAGVDVYFVCVQTPAFADGTCDISYVESALAAIGRVAREGSLVVIKSTTPPGTLGAFKEALEREDVRLAVNPEFLREGRSVEDFFHPDRTVIGVETHTDEVVLRDLYAFLDAPLFAMNIVSAQITKYAANTMLALRLSYINEIANIAQAMGGHIKDIEQAVGADPRIGSKFLRSGAGFGGSCFPKDVLALHEAGKMAGYESRLIAPVIAINTEQPGRFVENLAERVALEPGTKIAVWGLAFNKDTDDVRESPALKIVSALLAKGVEVVAHDPEAIANARLELGASDRLNFVVAKEEALPGADALLVLTEWDEYLEADFALVKAMLKSPVVGDGKHVLDHWGLRKQGFTIVGIGL